MFQKLADQCAMGDMVSMLEMGRWHFEKLDAAQKRLFRQYEAGDEGVYGALYQMTLGHYYQVVNAARYYVTWVYRAALYGNGEARALVEKCPLYSRASLLKKDCYRVGGIRSELMYASELNRLGFTQVSPRLEEFHLYPLRREGYFPCCYLADYIPADESGFGREDDYENIYYDEFFNCLGKNHGLLPARIAAARLKREAYWANPAHDAKNRKYRCSPLTEAP